MQAFNHENAPRGVEETPLEDLARRSAPTELRAPREVEETPLESNLRQLLPERIEVNLVEYVEDHDPEVVRAGFVPQIRTARISTFVPMKIFHRMLAGRERVMRLKQAAEGGESAAIEHSAEYMDWVVEMVLDVWKLSEPWMTREALENGLDLDQVMELFERFFGASIRRMAERGRFLRAQRGG